jgi:hypothetical protein
VIALGVGVLGYGVVYGVPIMIAGAAVVLWASFGWGMEPSTADDSDFEPPAGGNTKELAAHG